MIAIFSHDSIILIIISLILFRSLTVNFWTDNLIPYQHMKRTSQLIYYKKKIPFELFKSKFNTVRKLFGKLEKMQMQQTLKLAN